MIYNNKDSFPIILRWNKNAKPAKSASRFKHTFFSILTIKKCNQSAKMIHYNIIMLHNGGLKGIGF